MSFASLPDESIQHIFSFLNPSTLSICSNVCHRWKGIGDDQRLWKRYFKRLSFFYDKENLTENWDFHREVVKVIDFANGHIKKAEPYLASFLHDKWLISVYEFWSRICHEDLRMGRRHGNKWLQSHCAIYLISLEKRRVAIMQHCQYAEMLLGRARLSHLTLSTIGEGDGKRAKAIEKILYRR